jgi:hypothetical protein
MRAATILLAAGVALSVAGLFRASSGSPALGNEYEAELQSGGLGPRVATYTLDCTAQARPISPLIYGTGGSVNPFDSGITARRHGGNPTSRYNWELDAWNAGSDWFFKNAAGQNPRMGLERFLEENLKHGVKSAVTLSMLGWVAKDGTSYSFPVSVFGPQQATAPEDANAGNGVSRDGKPIPPGAPTVTSVQSTPETIARWVRVTRDRDRTRGRSVDSYILDNEPMLWNSTHRDVHPVPTTYDELLEKTIAYGSAIRREDPEGKVAGPAEWGWLGYHYSARDLAAGVLFRPDRRKHGDVALIPWYLRQLAEYQQRTGTRILDILDAHFYPMAEGVFSATGGRTDAATNARRIRSTRGLWDPNYVDESWINERMQVLPRLMQWIAENYPGLGLSIGEWSFGAENHISGGLASAEALGRFGLYGVTSAYHWGTLAENSELFWAFRAYRNFDTKGGRFQDWSVPVIGDGTLVSLFASRDAGREKLVAVLLNLAPLSPLTARITLSGCAAATGRGFEYTGGAKGFTDLPISVTKETVTVLTAPYSINVIDLRMSPDRP